MSTLLGATSTLVVTLRLPIRELANTSGSPAAAAVPAAIRDAASPQRVRRLPTITNSFRGDGAMLRGVRRLRLKCLQNIRGRSGFDVVGSPVELQAEVPEAS